MSKTLRVKNQACLARKLGISKATVSKYVHDGLPAERGGFDVEKAQAWHDEAVTRTKAGTAQTPAGRTADERYREAKAGKMEKELAESLGELVPRADVTREWRLRVLQVKDHFLFLGREVAPQLVGLSVRQIQVEIDRRVFQILAQLSTEPKGSSKGVMTHARRISTDDPGGQYV
jgi:predicted transcriptional regulator